MKWNEVRLVSVVAVSMLVGCSNHNVSDTGVQPAMQSGHAAPAVGDTAEYVTSSAVAGMQSTGHRKVSVVQSANHGRSIPSYITRTFDVREDTLQNLGGVSKSRTVITWLGVDNKGNVYLLGVSMDGRNWDVVSDSDPPVCMPCEIMPGSSWKYDARLASGNTTSLNCSCVGTESMSTPAGTFEALKLTISFSYTGMGGVSYSGYEWVCSAISYVLTLKTDVNSTVKLGAFSQNVRLVETLQSFNSAK